MPLPIASFSASAVAGDSPLDVQFTDTSLNAPTSWAWDFGDGTASAVRHPLHTYTHNGTFTVTLVATNSAGVGIAVGPDLIVVTPENEVYLVDGSRKMWMTRDREGHREYKIEHLVRTSQGNGPAAALTCPGLPTPGSEWLFDHEVDLWATCKLDADVQPYSLKSGEPPTHYTVTQTYSSKGDDKKCKDEQQDDPLLQPPKVSGNSNKFNEEATKDRFGKAIKNSSHEPFKGTQVEYEEYRDSVKVEQNVADPNQGYVLPYQMRNTVNDLPLWGFPSRSIRLAGAPWERKFYGHCSIYYTRTLEFEIYIKKDPDTGAYVSGWDRDLQDEGAKVLNGHWDPASPQWVVDRIGLVAADSSNPAHFIKAVDRKGNPMHVILDGAGRPAFSRRAGTAQQITPPLVLSDGSISPLAPSVQPTAPVFLIVDVTDDDGSIDTGELTIIGTDESDNVIFETFILWMGTVDFKSQKKYKTVTSIQWDDVLGAGPGSLDTVQVSTDDFETTQGKIHVEKHNESNFLLLGIPATF